MGKREKLKEFHHSNILEIARRLFVEKGVVGTTMDDIAKEGEYSKSTLYAYFKSKDEIYSNLVLENTILLRDSIEQAIKENNNLESAYLAICQAHVDFQENHPLYFETMIGGITENAEDNETNKAIANIGDQINQIIVDFLDDSIQSGQVRPDIDPLQTAFALWAGICGLITMTHNKASYIQCVHVAKEDFLEYGFKTFLNSIVNKGGE